MFKLLSIAFVSAVGMLLNANAAMACGGGSCCHAKAAPAACSAMPGMPEMNAPPANAQARAGGQVYRSYSYEPQGAQRSYGRSYRAPSRGEYDAGRKMRGL